MPLYKFKAKDKKGKTVEDVVQATNKKEVVALLKSENYKVLTIKGLEGRYKGIFLGGISVSDKAALCRFLATMLRAGLPLPDAIDIIRQETQSKNYIEAQLQACRQYKLKGDYTGLYQSMLDLSTALSREDTTVHESLAGTLEKVRFGGQVPATEETNRIFRSIEKKAEEVLSNKKN